MIKQQNCDGQSLYLAQRVDDVVLEVIHEMFTRIRTKPYDAAAERRVRQMEQEQRRQKQEAEKKLKAIQHRLEGYEDEVIRVIDGTSKFSDEMLARLIARTEAELQQEKVRECKVSSLRIVNKRLHQVEQVPYSLLVHFVAVG